MIQYVAVLPAYAGMFLTLTFAGDASEGSPRVCGDVSGSRLPRGARRWFSPRMRGCFRKSAARRCALLSSPRVCGDVSKYFLFVTNIHLFSPRMRGCFIDITLDCEAAGVLPAYAGMFPAFADYSHGCCSSPRVCGDVSATAIRSRTNCAFSPRMRGCFH